MVQLLESQQFVKTKKGPRIVRRGGLQTNFAQPTYYGYEPIISTSKPASSVFWMRSFTSLRCAVV
jgi:hypothetical protein